MEIVWFLIANQSPQIPTLSHPQCCPGCFAVYGVVAQNRYNWFGKLESCKKPDPELKARFIEFCFPEPPNDNSDTDGYSS